MKCPWCGKTHKTKKSAWPCGFEANFAVQKAIRAGGAVAAARDARDEFNEYIRELPWPVK